MDKPPFDPTQPYQPAPGPEAPLSLAAPEKPPFDPTQPFQVGTAPSAAPVESKPPFAPDQPFEAHEAFAEIPSAPEQAAIDSQKDPSATKEQPTPPPENDEKPGFWSAVTSAFSKGLTQQVASDMAGSQVLLPQGVGGSSLEEQWQQKLLHPQTKDAIDKLLDQPISEGWSDPEWWGAQLANSAGGMVPGIGAALAASAVASPVAGIAAFASEAALSRVVPAYNAARAAGLGPNDAMQRALIDTGITTSFAAAMGLVGKFPLTGTIKNEMNLAAADLLKRPMLEAMVQIGAVQPSLMAGQDIVTDLSHGESPEWDRVSTDLFVGALAGAGIHETFRSADKIQQLMNARAEMPMGREIHTPASDAAIAAAAEAQRPKGPTDRLPEQDIVPRGPGEEPMPIDGAVYDRDITPAAGTSQFFSAVKNWIDTKMPENMNAASVRNEIAKQPYVTRGEMEWLGLDDYLKDVDGQVNKKDLLAHVESKQVQVKEVRYEDPPEDPMLPANALYDQYAQEYGTPNIDQWPVGSQRHFEEVRRVSMARAIESQGREPQFRAWNPPDAQNIREFVLAVPPPELHPDAIDVKAEQLWNEKNVRRFGPWHQVPEEMEIKDRFREAAKDHLYAEDPTVYTGAHHQVPNAFAHFRTADYVDHNGRRLLGLMEAQSDIHQEAARAGRAYQERGTISPAQAEAEASAAHRVYNDTLNRAMRTYAPIEAIRRPEVQAAADAWRRSLDVFKAANEKVIGRAPALPFKTEWSELTVKRLLQIAADEGYDGVFWLNGDQVGMRLENKQQLKGAYQSYNKGLNGLFRKWARKVGSYTEPTKITAFQRDWEEHLSDQVPFRRDQLRAMGLDTEAMKTNMWMPVGPEQSSLIRKGLPLWDKDVTGSQHPQKGTRTLSEVVQDNPQWRRLLPAAGKIDKVISKVANELRVGRGISIVARDFDQPWRGRLVPGWDPATGHYVIEVNLRRILTDHDLYASMSHEFGHVLYKELYEKASDEEKAAIKKAYDDFRSKIPSEELKVGDVRRIRDNAISEMTGARAAGKDLRISQLSPRTKEYLLGKEEWWAEQVAKWMTTSEKPMSVVEKFFKRLTNRIRKMIAAFTQTEFGPNAKPDAAVQAFLDNKYGMPISWMEAPDEQFDMDTKKKAQAAFDREGAPETKAVPQQASGNGGRSIIKALGFAKEGGDAMAAHGDRMNWFYKWMTSLPQVAQLNPHLRDLAEYTDMHRIANLMKNEIMSKAQDRDRQWSTIRDPKQLEAITNFISDYANGLFKLPHTEDGIFRRPNAEEFAALVKKHGLSDQGVKLFQGLVTDFDGFLERYRALLIQDAWKIKDPVRQKNTMANINATMDKLLQRPFMPLTRFGKYSISVYGHDGKLRHYEQTNSLRQQKKIVEALEKHADRLPGDRVLPGMVPKDVRPFLGMPPGLIDLISDKLSLSATQRAALDQLKFDYAPAQTFKHQFRNLDLTPGWSTDYRRAYAHFFFHGANHITRITWADQMRDAIARLGSEKNRLLRAGQPGGTNKLDQIVKYTQTHFDTFIDPKSDWATARGLMFHWYLGFNPASAMVNLTQTPLMTHPYLASKFGDLAAARSIAKASTDLNNFYRKTTLSAAAEAAKGVTGTEAAKSRAFGHAIKYGLISETQAHELAAVAEDRNLLRIFGNKGEQFWLKFQEASSWMFENSEQWNRRVAFASAWDLAYQRPNHALIQEATQTYPLLFKQLTDVKTGSGMTPHEAGAFLAAMRATEQTQFNYAPYARPPIMRGKIGGTALVFKLFTQNSMFNIISNPAMAWRWALIMGALGGLQGLMGFENVNSLLKTVAYRAFGKDFDLEDEARHFAHDVLNDAISPDILMHGLSAKGFGIPAVMHSVGARWFPTVDLSKSIGMGDVIGFDPFSPLGPNKQPKDEEFRQLTRATGAAFGLPLSLYDFATSNDNFTDLKKYETIMPRFLGSLSHAYRFASQGMETNRAGNAVVKFDPADTEQMMEILARAAGFQPRRLTEEWSRIQATSEAATYWDLRRQGLIRQFADTVKNNDLEGRGRVRDAIRLYNQTLPPEARGKAITGQELQTSIQQRMRVKALQEAGLPAQKSNIPLAKDVEKYYPRNWPNPISTKTVQ